MRPVLMSFVMLFAFLPTLAAHPGHEHGIMDGALHPLLGIDHLLAMVAVGLLAVRGMARGDRHAWWQVPSAFLGAMTLGAGAGLAGLALPGVEWGIAWSVLVFGCLIARSAAPRTWVVCALVAGFAVLHGHAHVAEMGSTHVGMYVTGMLLTSGGLHGLGLVAGVMAMRMSPQVPLRLSGVGVALAGFAMVIGILA